MPAPGSKPFSFDADDLKSLGWTLLDVATAAAVASFLEWTTRIEATDAVTIGVVGVVTVLVKAGRKWISDNRKRWAS